MVKLRTFKNKSSSKRLNYIILAPTYMSITGVIEDDEACKESPDRKRQAFTIDFQEISLNMCPLMLNTSIKMLNSIQNSLNQRFKSEEICERKETITNTSDLSLFNPVSFDTDEFWFTQLKDENMSQSSSSSDLGSLEDGSRRGSEFPRIQKEQVSFKWFKWMNFFIWFTQNLWYIIFKLLIRTGKISIKLEADVSEQIPLVGLNLSANGEINNWTLNPSLSVKINLEMAYFNEALTVWEPVIEPVEDVNENLKPYELSIDVYIYLLAQF